MYVARNEETYFPSQINECTRFIMHDVRCTSRKLDMNLEVSSSIDEIIS